MPPISAVFIALNEEKRLAPAIESVAGCDEIIVLDAGSTDRTCAIASSLGARVIVNAPWPGYVAQRNRAIDAARNDWILALDADERLTPALRQEILSLAERGFDRDGYRIPRVACYLGRWIRATDWYPDRQLRLFNRRWGRWQGGCVHESVAVRGDVGRLEQEIEHHPYGGIDDHVRRIAQYTTLWAEEAIGAGRRPRISGLTVDPAWSFVRNFVLRRGFKLGTIGLVVSLLNAHYTFLKHAKLWERAMSARQPRP